MENVEKDKCPKCGESFADGLVKNFGVPTKYKEVLNIVQQCLHCKFIFSYK
jgi:C4-type Zn-finger protein